LNELKNYYISDIKEIYGPKKVISFDYEEKINFKDDYEKLPLYKDNKNNPINENKLKNKKNGDDDFTNLKNRNKYINIIDDENENEKGKLKGKTKINNINNKFNDDRKDNEQINLKNKNNNNINKSQALKENHNKNRRKKNDKKFNNNHHQRNHTKSEIHKDNYSLDNNYTIKNYKNKKNDNKNKRHNSAINNKLNYRKPNGQLSYASRKRMENKFKKNDHFHPNEEKYAIINRNIFLGRTLPEMIVLNSHRLVDDDDYKMFQNILNYNKNHKKIKIKRSELNNINNKSDTNINDIDFNKPFKTQIIKNNQTKDEIIHNTYA
jgi:hypothetical protein